MGEELKKIHTLFSVFLMKQPLVTKSNVWLILKMQTDQKEEPKGDAAKTEKVEEKKEGAPPKKVKKYKSIDLPILSTVHQLSKTDINLLYEKEVSDSCLAF